MNNLRKQVSYLQGLSEGLNIESGSKEGRILAGIIGVLDEMSEQIQDMAHAQMDIEEYVESIDEDLYELEVDIHGDYMDTPEEVEDMEYYEVECPECRENVYFDAGIVDDDELIEVTCPNCDEVVYVNDEDPMEASRDENILRRPSGMAMKKDTEDI